MDRVLFVVDKRCEYNPMTSEVFVDEDICYSMIGQHQYYENDWVRDECRLATADEYDDVLNELYYIGYKEIGVLNHGYTIEDLF